MKTPASIKIRALHLGTGLKESAGSVVRFGLLGLLRRRLLGFLLDLLGRERLVDHLLHVGLAVPAVHAAFSLFDAVFAERDPDGGFLAPSRLRHFGDAELVGCRGFGLGGRGTFCGLLLVFRHDENLSFCEVD